MSSHSVTKLPLRWGIIGCGAVTEVKSGPAYQLEPRFSLEMVMRRDGEKAADYAHRHQVPLHTNNADELLSHPMLDAIYVATPPDSHLQYALAAAKAGKICCVEKPMALTTAQCQVMVEAFEQAKLPLFVAYYRRSLPRFLQVKQWLESQVIGSIRHVHWQLSRPVHPRDLTPDGQNWRTDPKQAGGGYFVDLASHGLDLLQFLLGDITQVHGICQRQAQLYAAEDAVTAIWQHQAQADGAVATGSGSWHFSADQRRDQVLIQGSHGSIEFSVFEEQALQLRHIDAAGQQHDVTMFVDNPTHIQQYHVANMAKAVLEDGFVHPSTGRSALRTTAVMEAILTGVPLHTLLAASSS